MRKRINPPGNKNLIGARVELRRKQLGLKQSEVVDEMNDLGVEMSYSGLSKIESQIRSVNDFELIALSEILDISVLWLLGLEENNRY